MKDLEDLLANSTTESVQLSALLQCLSPKRKKGEADEREVKAADGEVEVETIELGS